MNPLKILKETKQIQREMVIVIVVHKQSNCQKTSVLYSIKIVEMCSRKQKMKMRGLMFILYSVFKYDKIARKIKI